MEMKTRILVDLLHDEFPKEIENLYEQYFTVFQRYVQSKGYPPFITDIDNDLVVDIDTLITSGHSAYKGTEADPLPEAEVMRLFLHVKQNTPDTVLVAFIWPWSVKPILQLNNPYAKNNFARPDLGYCYIKTPFLSKNMSLVEATAYLGTAGHELEHLLLWDDANRNRTYLIDYDPAYKNVTEAFEGLNFQKLPPKI